MEAGLVRCRLDAVEGAGLAQGFYCVVRLPGRAAVQPEVGQVFFLEVPERGGEAELTVEVHDNRPLRSGAAGQASLPLEMVLRSPGEQRLRFRGANGKGVVRMHAALCTARDSLVVNVRRIRRANAGASESETCEAKRLLVRLEAAGRCVREFHADLAGPSAEPGGPSRLDEVIEVPEHRGKLLLSVEECRADSQVAQAVLRPRDLKDGRFFLFGAPHQRGQAMFEVELGFTWEAKVFAGAAAPAIAAVTAEGQGQQLGAERTSRRSPASRSADESEVHLAIGVGSVADAAAEEIFGAGLVKTDEWKQFRARLEKAQHASVRAIHALQQEALVARSEHDALRRRLRAAKGQRQDDALRGERLERLVRKLRDENHDLKRVLQHLAPHWERIDVRFAPNLARPDGNPESTTKRAGSAPQ